MAAAVFAVPACSSGVDSGASDMEEIRIGTPLPLSGPNAPLGKDVLQGAELAADIINDGLPGLKLPLANDKASPTWVAPRSRSFRRTPRASRRTARPR